MSILYSPFLPAAETDGFTSRYDHTDDGVPHLNIEINRRLNLIVKTLNREQNSSPQCDWDELASQLGDQLRRPFRGQMEHFINTSLNLPKSDVDFEHSIFKNVSSLQRFPIRLGMWVGIGFAAPIHHDGYLIGADKFGHFIDEGYYYYSLVHNWDVSFAKTLKMGRLIEYTFEGKFLSGVYSYADLAANYDGYEFWLNLLGSPEKNVNSKYISCGGGIWSLKKPIDLATYVSSSWDEGMNCNDYLFSGMREGIQKSIKELEKRTKKTP